MYRWWILGCLLLLAVTHTARHSIASAPATTAPPSPLASAQAQEASLLAIEWYTNETVRKALQAEQAGDAENARRFGEKAIESDRKATHIREQTAAAWLQVNDTTRAREVWTRAATMAEERATLLGNRIATMHQLWQRSATQPIAAQQEQEIRYLQALLLTAQQWAVAAEFHQRAQAPARAEAALRRNAALLPALNANQRLQTLDSDERLAGAAAQVAAWQRAAATTVSP